MSPEPFKDIWSKRPMPNAMTSKELSWVIDMLRTSISLDWAKLATSPR
jgi:hypothetical protein